MPAQRPERPQPGQSLVLPRVTDDTTGDAAQRSFDRLAGAHRQIRSQLDSITSDVDAIKAATVVGEVNVRSYKAKGDGSADDTDAIQAAFDDAKKALAGAGGSYGAIVFFPRGTYMARPGLKLPNGVGIRGDGPASSCIMQLPHTSGSSLISNSNQDGTQEFAFIERIRIDGNRGNGGVCTTAVVDLVSLFINSYVRDVLVLEGSNVGLRIAATNGMGPVLVENTWVLHNSGHNILIEEVAGNPNACAGINLHHVTSENWGANSSAIYLKGVGASGNYLLSNIHIEHGGDVTGLTGITFDGVSHVRAQNIQLQAGIPASYTQGIHITSAPGNVDIEIDDVTNINGINPVLVDDAYGATLGAVNISRYVTPDVTTYGGSRFAPSTNNTSSGATNVAMALVSHDSNNIYTASFPGGGGGVVRWVYTPTGKPIMQWGTDATVFFYESPTLQNGLRGFATRVSAPSTGTHAVGDIVFNADPVAGGYIGWVCTSAGTPGTWKQWGAILP